ncbi:S1C family serine protease [Desulforhopalus singaporensis]|uniref:DegP2 peptidase. Serine peptidase. MEROPS family S01B n=1 Tax=Desulforhopalus singaporensis TaxID=91360 RepID=A0A1H0PTM0_9BACT|nr:trypsin-like peptidase domain-containing protein [Desulforhopalus singaporensis]SDP08491.1 DegP2 peptidase. Serine peptidase. MEROPS family S01B [Desulforhopalus singaporensis]
MKKTSPLAVLVIVALTAILLYNPVSDYFARRGAEPRAVTARGNLAEDENNTIEIFRENSSSVVYVTSIALKRDLFSLNAVEIPRGTGSGFVWDTKGRIVTNYHVISDANRLQVTMADGSSWKAFVIGVAPDKDLAVLQIDASTHRLKPIAIGSSADLLVGQKVFAIGNPFGLDQTITSGIISALNREITAVTGRIIKNVIQTDAAINPGNSGGPLLDSAGRLIGVNTAIYSPSGAYAGIGFAVPVDTVNSIVPQLIKKGRVLQPGIGVTLADERLTRRLGIEGVLVINVSSKSPAEEAGLRSTKQYGQDIVLGDIIVAVNGVAVSSHEDLREEFEKLGIGSEVLLTIMRDDRQQEVKIRLTAVN